MVRELGQQHLTDGETRHPLPSPRGEWARREEDGAVFGPAVGQAEELLDWLEGHGCTGLEVSAVDGSVRVRCVCPPGFWLGGGGPLRLWVV